jgi:cytochrome P450
MTPAAEPRETTPDGADLDRMAVELLLDRDVRADPYAHYRALREMAPMHHAGFGRLWFASRYEDCHQVLRHPDAVQPPTELPGDPEPGSEDAGSGPMIFGRRRRDVDPVVTKSLLRLNPPDHTRLRGLVSRGFTPRRVEQLRPAIETMTDAVLDDLADAGSGDLLDLVGFPLPVRVIGELVGVPAQDRDQFRSLVRDAATSLEPGLTPEQEQAAATAGLALRSYFRDLIVERRARPLDDLTSALVGVQTDQLAAGPDGDDGGEPLTDDEMVATLILIFAAGFETTTNLIGNGLWCLLKHPEELARLRADHALAPAAVEEMLRYQSPVQMDARRARTDIAIGGHTVEAGEWVITFLGAANRDPEKFEDPETFRITERATPVLSFGNGIHYCLGASLARLEGRVFFTHLLDRFASIELDAEPVWRNTFTLRGLESLPVSVS